MTPRTRRVGAAFALTSAAAVGLAALGPGLPGEEGKLAAHSATAPTTIPTAAPSTVTSTVSEPDAADPADATSEPTAARSGVPAPVDVSHLPPPPAAAADAQASTASEGRSRTQAGRVIQIRAGDIRLLSNGRLLFEAPRPAGPMSLGQLARFLNSPRWLERSGDTTTIKAAIYLSPGTHLTIGPGDATTVRLEQTPSGFGGNIYGSGATLTVAGAEVTSWDPATGAPAPLGQTRPFISFNRGSALRFTDATFTSLGRTGSGQTGVTLHDGREFVALRTTFVDGVIGMASVRTTSTRLDRVTARHNAGTGVLVRGRLEARSVTTTSNAGPGLQVEAAPRTDVWSVKSERNAGPGISVRGSNVVDLDALRANGNGGGLELARSSRVTVTDTVTTGNAGVGVDVSGSNTVAIDTVRSVQDGSGLTVRDRGTSITVTDVGVHSAADVGVRLGAKGTAADDLDIVGTPSGIVLDATGTGTTVEDAHIQGAQTGLRVMAGNTDSSVSGVRIGPLANAPQGAAPADAGADIGGHGTSLRDLDVRHATTGYVVRGSADGVSIAQATASDTDTGVRVQEGVDGVELRNITVTGGSAGLDSAASGLVVTSSNFTDVSTGAKLTAAATLTDVVVDASECGIRSVAGAAQIDGGSVRATRASCGEADLGGAQVLPPAAPRGLGLFAGGMVTLAIVYESVRAVRERGRRNTASSSTTGAADRPAPGGDSSSGSGTTTAAPDSEKRQVRT